MKILDTSFIVSLFLLQDSNHQNAIELFEKNIDEQLLLPEQVLQETLTVTLYKAGIEKCKKVYERLTSNEQISLVRFTQTEIDEITNIFLAQSGKLSFPDFSVIYLSKKSKSKILSFDKDLLAY